MVIIAEWQKKWKVFLSVSGLTLLSFRYPVLNGILFLRSDQIFHPIIRRSVVPGIPNHERLPYCPHRHGVQSIWDDWHSSLQWPERQEGLHLSCSGQRQGGAQVSIPRMPLRVIVAAAAEWQTRWIEYIQNNDANYSRQTANMLQTSPPGNRLRPRSCLTALQVAAVKACLQKCVQTYK